MMTTAIAIALQEWRYWSRTKLGAAAAMLALFLVCISVFASLSQQAQEKNTRESLQIKAEETFRDQPARHPHRMVHYGHYVFRTPTALAALDPGVDSYTGTVMFLEGHRQNTATFSPNYDGAQAGPFARLTPALAYQLLVPLVLVVMGFSVVAREREAMTDRQLITSGISPISIWLGKTLALVGVAALMLLPLLIGVILSESLTSVGLGFFAIYALYLLVWALIISAVSTWSRSTSASLLIMLTIWTVLCVVSPRMVASAANTAIPTASQIEMDMDVLVALRSIGDGHNANDAAFNRLRANLLEEYGVQRVEDLPVNFRGVVARTNEAELTEIVNKFAQERTAKHVRQTTDGKTHHRFLREAEAIRYEFVQSLNQAHEEKLNYIHDINRNKDEASSQRSRISADNWHVLNDFRFEADPAPERLKRLSQSFLAFFVWVLVFILLGFLGARRLHEADHG